MPDHKINKPRRFRKSLKKAIVIFGSARSNGNTRKALDKVLKKLKLNMPVVDINEFTVLPFDYLHNQDDDYSFYNRKNNTL